MGASYVSAGKPNVAGAIYRAPLGSTLPTDATTALDVAFVHLGYASEDGVVNENTPETDEVKAWGGDTVLTLQTEKNDTFTVTLLETMDVNVLSAIYGSANVSGTLSSGITVSANGSEAVEASWVFEIALRGGGYKRICIPDGKITEIGEITYTDDQAIGYEITITAFVDSSGNTHYEYIKRT